MDESKELNLFNPANNDIFAEKLPVDLNFLSHYYFDKSSDQPERVLGLILPDLVHQHNKTWIFKPERRQNTYLGACQHLYQGWTRHKQVDKYFHTSPYFTEQSKWFKEKIQSVFSKSPVWSFFLAHISLELCLDSLLLTEGEIDVHRFYGLLARVDPAVIIEFLEINQVEDPSSFLLFYDQFITYPYLEKYIQPGELIYPLGRICFRIWKERFTAEQNAVLKEAILLFCAENRSRFLEIFQYIELNLPRPDLF